MQESKAKIEYFIILGTDHTRGALPGGVLSLSPITKKIHNRKWGCRISESAYPSGEGCISKRSHNRPKKRLLRVFHTELFGMLKLRSAARRNSQCRSGLGDAVKYPIFRIESSTRMHTYPVRYRLVAVLAVTWRHFFRYLKIVCSSKDCH